jgi:alkylated DNA repair dioxygenase AlkB
MRCAFLDSRWPPWDSEPDVENGHNNCRAATCASTPQSNTVVSQGNLFSTEPVLPEGFVYQRDFLTAADEADLLRNIQHETFDAFDFQGYRAKRRRIEYGLEYDFSRRRANPTKPIPEFLLSVRRRAAEFAQIVPDELAEGLILEYPPGAPIGWHRDAPQFGNVIGISLLAPARMRLKPYNKPGKIISVNLEPRSIYMLQGAVRWQWQHSIPAQDSLRYSITFRTLREKQQNRIA